MILSTPLCGLHHKDQLIWDYANNGLFTVKSDYWLAEELGRIQTKRQFEAECSCKAKQEWWVRIWSLMVPFKVKFFFAQRFP